MVILAMMMMVMKMTTMPMMIAQDNDLENCERDDEGDFHRQDVHAC